MALTTYTDLTDTVAAYLNRSDLSAKIPDFIRLAEARMQRELRAFSTRNADFALPLSATTGRTSNIPGIAGIVELGAVRFRVLDAALTFNPGKPLPQVSADQLLAWQRDQPTSGEPQAFAVIGQQFAVYPFPNVPKDSLGANSSYQLFAEQVGPTASFAVPITAANYALNPIWTEHPDLYLYGALAESAPYLQHDERLPIWEGRFREIVKAVNVQHDRLAYGPRSQRVTLDRVFG